MKKTLFVSLLIMGAIMISCTNKTYRAAVTSTGSSSPSQVESPSAQGGNMVALPSTGGPVSNILPDATAFRMTGDYENNVAITLNRNGEIIYFPAPSDITADSEPIELGKGWWLNRQGLGPNSVFTSYTFAEYASLPETPSVEQLKKAIIPGAKVTEFIELPVKAGEAVMNLDYVKEYVKNL